MSKPRLPVMDSVQELAAFWDTHDLTDFVDDLEEVPQKVFERQPAIAIRLKTEELAAVDALAQQKGVERATLLRQWELAHIQAA